MRTVAVSLFVTVCFAMLLKTRRVRNGDHGAVSLGKSLAEYECANLKRFIPEGKIVEYAL